MVPSAGNCRNADGSRSACLNHVLEITNRSSLGADKGRPEILISGALHGDERIGPATALALARWLCSRARARGRYCFVVIKGGKVCCSSE